MMEKVTSRVIYVWLKGKLDGHSKEYKLAYIKQLENRFDVDIVGFFEENSKFTARRKTNGIN